MMYRFHPSVQWERGYPDRQQILSQLRQLWENYGLDSKTKFNTKITKVYQDDKGRWILNDPSNGTFDGLIAAVGTCGEPKRTLHRVKILLRMMLIIYQALIFRAWTSSTVPSITRAN